MNQTKAILLTISVVIFAFLLQVYYINFSISNQIKIYENNILKEARNSFSSFLTIKMWNTTNNGVYIKEDDKYSIISPITMTKQIFDLSSRSNIQSYKITSLNPNNENNKPNYFERKVLKEFEKKDKTEFFEFNNNRNKLKYMASLTVTRACLECHSSQGYKIGDIRGGIRVTLDTSDYQEFYINANKKRDYYMLFSFFITLLVFLVLIYFVNNIYKKHRTIMTISDKNKVLSQRYEHAINGSKDGLWDWDLSSNKVYFSKIWKEMLGYKENELTNSLETWKKLVHPDDIELATKDILANHRGKTTHYENVHRLKHKDGHWVWILDRGKTIFDKNGIAIRMVGFHTDITKQKELEVSLMSSEKNLLKAEKMSNLGHFRYDFKNNILTLSKNIKTVFGLDDETKITLEDLVKNFTHEEDRENVVKRFFLGKYKKRGYRTEYRIIRQSDKEVRHVNCNIEFKKDKSKEVNLVIGTIQDITEFALIQNELSILRQAVEQAPISFVITNVNGEVEYVNSHFTKVSGYSFSEITGKNIDVLQSDTMDEEEYNALWETISSGKTWSGVFKNISKSKKEFWERAIIFPIFSKKDKKIINYMAIKQEITKELKLQEELKDKEELMIAQSRHAAMGEMISMIAHQWRQPISVVAMSANNILMDIELDMLDKEALKENAQDIISQTQYLSQTIEDFRNFFKPNKQKESFYVEDVFKDAISVMGKTLENNNIELNQEFTSGKKVNSFEKEFLQVIINILKNAKEVLVQREIENRRIDIYEYLDSENIIIKICDNAGGIPEEIIHNIFEPYFTTKNELEGTGLGLYMSKTIVEKHLEGKIKAYNQNFGACFEIVLKGESV
ncbi:MAG: PAS domain-containing protein [Campylobacteraceae bacterium]|nr:PAS domain-containing protein [Campylobacteraceae bacterium]